MIKSARASGRVLGWFLCSFLFWTGLAAAQTKLKELPDKYRLWLEEEVAYIITPGEKDVFLQLDSDNERELFIQAFWKHRDPTQGTDKNEFREEHYRRLNYVNRRYRYSGKPGWKTDRGKAYILLGEPNDIRIFQGSDAYYAAELWAYQDIKLNSLPSAFNLLFFQKGRIGDYILYNPAMMGPQSLLTNFMEDPTDYMRAYYELEEIQPVLAQASLSLIPGESVVQYPSMASTALIQNLDGAIIRSVEDMYAKKFRDYKDIVEVEYSTNYMDSEAQLQIIKDPSGIPFVHFSIEPKNLSMGNYQNNIYTNLEFNGILRDTQGKTIYQMERKVPLNFTKEQFESMRYRPFSFTDKFPVVPGDYELLYLVKNTVSKEFASFEARISISPDPEIFTMTPLLLGFNTAPVTDPDQSNKPFVVQNLQIYSQAKKSFLAKDKLYIYFQVWSMPPQLQKSGSIEYTFFEESTEKFKTSFPVQKYQNTTDILEVFPLEGFEPGYYTVIAALCDESGNEVFSQKEIFEISPASSIPRPWVLAQTRIGPNDPETFHILGSQLFNKMDYEGAFGLLEKAFDAEPGNFQYGLSFARANFQLKRYEEVLDILQPLAERTKDNYDLAYMLGQTYQILSQFDRAIESYNVALNAFGVNTSLLNGLGECYFHLGQREEALVSFQKSLEIDPDQEEIKAKIRALKQ